MTGPESPEVGGIGEEAMKLLHALQGWARETGTHSEDLTGGFLREVNEHIATGGEACRYCPVCRVISAVRTTSPEVRHHLSVATSSLLQAIAVVLATPPTEDRSHGGPVEHIDLDGDNWEEEES